MKFKLPKTNLLQKLLIALVLFILLNVFLKPVQKTLQQNSGGNIPITTSSPESSQAPTSTPLPIRYYLRSTEIKEPVSWAYWVYPQPHYLVGNRLLNSINLETLYTFPIGSKPYTQSHSLLIGVTYGNQIITYKPDTKETVSYEYTPRIFYSPGFSRKIVIESQKLNIYEENKLLTAFDVSLKNPNISWSKSENLFTTTTDRLTTIYNIASHQFYQIFSTSTPTQVEFSPNGKYIAISEDTIIKLYFTSNGNYFSSIPLDKETEKVVFSWGTSEKMFIFEKRFKPRERDYVYLYNPQTESKFQVTESLGIPSKINFDIPPVSRSDKAVLFLNNKGHPWVSSTDPVIPYQQEAPRSHDD